MRMRSGRRAGSVSVPPRRRSARGGSRICVPPPPQTTPRAGALVSTRSTRGENACSPYGTSDRSEGDALAAVTFDGVAKVYPDGTRAVDHFDLDIRDGEFMVLVGPSGCGKTTALRMLAGLEDISAGRVVIGDRVVNHVPPRDRDIAMVFQSYALYPHLSVYENIAFGLRVKKVPKREIDARVKEAARILDLEQLLARNPRTP